MKTKKEILFEIKMKYFKVLTGEDLDKINIMLKETFEAGQNSANENWRGKIRKRIEENIKCDKIDTHEEQHMEHLVIVAELKNLLSKGEKNSPLTNPELDSVSRIDEDKTELDDSRAGIDSGSANSNHIGKKDDTSGEDICEVGK